MSATQTPAEIEAGPTRIDGPPAAALVAVGVGAVVLGFFVTLAEASSGVADWLAWDDGVGPLSGKTVLATIAYIGSFLVLGLWWRGRTFALRPILLVAGILVVLGLLLTFPPIFQAFASE